MLLPQNFSRPPEARMRRVLANLHDPTIRITIITITTTTTTTTVTATTATTTTTTTTTITTVPIKATITTTIIA